MKLENQVTSLDLSKRLKELGLGQDAHFMWFEFPIARRDGGQDVNVELLEDDGTFEPGYSAFTVAELGEMLPRRLDHSTDELKAAGLHPPHMLHRLVTEHQDTRFMLAYICADCKGKTAEVYADTEADARAKMLIYLIENKLITL